MGCEGFEDLEGEAGRLTQLFTYQDTCDGRVKDAVNQSSGRVEHCWEALKDVDEKQSPRNHFVKNSLPTFLLTLCCRNLPAT